MAKKTEPFLDFSKFMMNLDLTKGTDEMTKMMAAFNLPDIDMDALVASQMGNLQALAAANRATLDGLKAVTEWQVRILKKKRFRRLLTRSMN